MDVPDPDELAVYQGEGQLTNEQLAAPPVFGGRGAAAEHPFAALYQGEFETPWDGTAIAVRRHARALHAAGVPVVLRSFSNVVVNEHGMPEPVHTVGIPAAVKAEIAHVHDTSAATLTPLIKHVVVRGVEHVRSVVYPRGIEHADLAALQVLRKAVADATILYTVWERDRVAADVVRLLNRVAQIWVPCVQNAEMLERSGVDAGRVRVVPHPYEDSSPLLKLLRRKPVTQRRFYTIGRWEPRKGYHELLGAFLKAFTPADDVSLTIKYNGGEWQGYPTPAQSFGIWGKDPTVQANGWNVAHFPSRVRVIGGRLPADKILKLHFENNIYVSASHGEAYCLPAFDAVLAGNRLVHVPYGGTADFAPPSAVSVPFQLAVAVPESYRWEPDAEWATYSEDDMIAALQSATAPAAYELPADFRERFGFEAVGKRMRELAIEVSSRTMPAAAAYFAEVED